MIADSSQCVRKLEGKQCRGQHAEALKVLPEWGQDDSIRVVTRHHQSFLAAKAQEASSPPRLVDETPIDCEVEANSSPPSTAPIYLHHNPSTLRSTDAIEDLELKYTSYKSSHNTAIMESLLDKERICSVYRASKVTEYTNQSEDGSFLSRNKAIPDFTSKDAIRLLSRRYQRRHQRRANARVAADYEEDEVR